MLVGRDLGGQSIYVYDHVYISAGQKIGQCGDVLGKVDEKVLVRLDWEPFDFNTVKVSSEKLLVKWPARDHFHYSDEKPYGRDYYGRLIYPGDRARIVGSDKNSQCVVQKNDDARAEGKVCVYLFREEDVMFVFPSMLSVDLSASAKLPNYDRYFKDIGDIYNIFLAKDMICSWPSEPPAGNCGECVFDDNGSPWGSCMNFNVWLTQAAKAYDEQQ